MKKIGKLSLVTAAAAISVLHAAGISSATATQDGEKMIIWASKGSSKQTILTFKQKDLLALSGKTIAAEIDPKSWTMSFSDPQNGKLLFSKKISKKLFSAQKIKEPISMITTYSKKHLTLQLSKDSVPSSMILLTSDAKSALGKHISMKLKNGKLSIAKIKTDLHATIGSLIGCTDTKCSIHSKHAAAIAANNPHYEKMLKKASWFVLWSLSYPSGFESIFFIKKELININS